MEGAHDIRGYRIFDAGELGQLHVLAHRMLDAGLPHEGYRRLAAGLRGRTGAGSDWVHVQWHLLVFELAVGRWHEARARFEEHVLSAVAAGEASTDGPAGLWRLRLALPRDVQIALPWGAVHAAAVDRLADAGDPYVALHHLLALAGAGDHERLLRWLARHDARSAAPPALRLLGWALHAYARGAWSDAVLAFDAGLRGLDALGGSRAQNELFHALRADASARIASWVGPTGAHAQA